MPIIIAIGTLILLLGVVELASKSWNQDMDSSSLEFDEGLYPDDGLNFFHGLIIALICSLFFWGIAWAVLVWLRD